jgi:hypothetical protein
MAIQNGFSYSSHLVRSRDARSRTSTHLRISHELSEEAARESEERTARLMKLLDLIRRAP